MTTDPRGSTSLSRLPSLTGLRFVAVLFVFAFHASLEAPFTDVGFGRGYADAVANAGWLGVSFFFVLSGFVLTWSARPRDTARAFWRRRAAKIYPLHAVTWAAALILLATAGTAATWRQAVPNLLLVHTWFPDRSVFSSLNDVSWSLSCEVFFYLLFPVLLRLVRRIEPGRLWRWAAVTALLVPLLPLVSELLPDSPALPFGSGSVWQFWFVYVLPVGRLLEFGFGILLARMVLAGRAVPVRVLPAAVLVLAGYALSLRLPFLYGLTSVTVVPIGLLIAAVAQRDVRGAGSPLAHPVAVRLGEWSFAFYLVHRLLLQHGHRLLGTGRTWPTPTALGLMAIAFALSLLLSWALHVAVERPAMRLLGRKRTAPVPVPAVAAPPLTGPPTTPEATPSTPTA
ncbi:acyltransferase family protein [Streptomyces cinerochromogenes]|uniref:Acyltransferase family protein n=1 Tax=Streptomyces cinerochromogenes TaxID=66422 RepID=A0ABW7BHI7_9ACTN